MRPSETPSAALDRLCRELELHRQQCGEAHVQHYLDALPHVEEQLREVPLVHGMNDIRIFHAVFSDCVLRSRADRGLDPLRPERYLGLSDIVYSSAGILYPDMNFAIVLSPRVEEKVHAEASPWDSGAMHRSLCPHLPQAADSPLRREVFLSHSLPAPQYRRYLVDYVASCFRTGVDYLRLHDPAHPDPLGAICGTWTSRIFEVRLHHHVPLDPWTVVAVFLLRDSRGEASVKLRKSIEPMEQQGIVIKTYDGAKSQLQWVVKDWMSRRACSTSVASPGGSS